MVTDERDARTMRLLPQPFPMPQHRRWMPLATRIVALPTTEGEMELERTGSQRNGEHLQPR